ncbi:DUF2716 domain-containing protein [Deinococcus marmoris]|uniref:DUF2716 domain-containing protein n=1 Tax=Deinococcus marmoris TaxID=249408 RepID=UPI0004980C15|nr:DUF2716 domain-containing protein [Deinococcus marmoris]
MPDQPVWWEIKEPEDSQVWSDFRLTFDFNPSTSSRDWPSFREPVPSVTCALSTEWDAAASEEFLALMKGHIRACARPDEWVYGLDPHHTCCRYNPHLLEEPAPDALGYRDPWDGFVLPNGDYGITLADDWRWGTLGHPWEWSLCVFG